MIIIHASIEKFIKEILVEKGINGIKGRVVAKKSHGHELNDVVGVNEFLGIYHEKRPNYSS
jgi:hypothetical protein